MSKTPRINPPEFDIIIDNPLEDEEDKKETLDLLKSFKGSFIPLVYSLRSIPGTTIREYAEEHPELDIPPIELGFRKTIDQEFALKVYNFGIGKPSKGRIKFFEMISKIAFIVPGILNFSILLTLGRRLFYDIKINNFSTLGTVFPNLVTFIFKSKLVLVLQGRLNGTVSNAHKNSIGPGQESAVH